MHMCSLPRRWSGTGPLGFKCDHGKHEIHIVEGAFGDRKLIISTNLGPLCFENTCLFGFLNLKFLLLIPSFSLSIPTQMVSFFPIQRSPTRCPSPNGWRLTIQWLSCDHCTLSGNIFTVLTK